METTEHNKALVRRLYEEIVSLENLDELEEIFDKITRELAYGKAHLLLLTP